MVMEYATKVSSKQGSGFFLRDDNDVLNIFISEFEVCMDVAINKM